MIITQEILTTLNKVGLLCDEGFKYLSTDNYLNKTRTQFIERMKQDASSGDCPADYPAWAVKVLIRSELMKHHPDFIPTGKLRVLGLQEPFYNIHAARIALQSLKNQNPNTSYLYCIEEETLDTSDPLDPQISWRQHH